MEHQGSIARTSRALYMHPNTLPQRLARIEWLADFDLDREDWLSLAMAIKAVKLELIRGSASTLEASYREAKPSIREATS